MTQSIAVKKNEIEQTMSVNGNFRSGIVNVKKDDVIEITYKYGSARRVLVLAYCE